MSLAAPLRLRPHPVTKVWGGDTLRDLVGAEPGVEWPSEPVGEVWMVSGMEGFASVVAEGPFEGRTLRGLMLSEQEALLGEARPADDGGFPLLLKFIDVGQGFSHQVFSN